MPLLGPRRVLIRVHAISLERGDLYCRRFVSPSSHFHVGGYQAAGIVEAVGSDVVRFARGDHVVAFDWQGSHAEFMSAPEATTYAVPHELSLRVAATAPVTFGTANDALFQLAPLRPGESVLINGAAGGVGLAAVQLAAAAGAHVIGTSSSEDRLVALRALGMSHGINYRTDNIAQKVRELTDGAGVDLVLDMVGGSAVSDLLSALRYRGSLIAVGDMGGKPTQFDVGQIVMAGVSVHGLLFGKEMARNRVRSSMAETLVRLATEMLTMPIARVFPLAHAADAHFYLETGHPFGRIILEPDS
jgi:NADPH:quinone reductase